MALIDAAESAGLAPLSATRFHQLVYLVNALAPVWDVVPLTQELLKLYGSPYDAELQQDVDALVGMGVILATDLHYERNERNAWQVAALYSTDRDVAAPIIAGLKAFPDEGEALQVAREVCLAISALPAGSVDGVLAIDVSYADPRASVNSLVNLYDSNRTNGTTLTAQLFKGLQEGARPLTPAEQANLYIRHLYRIATHVA